MSSEQDDAQEEGPFCREQSKEVDGGNVREGFSFSRCVFHRKRVDSLMAPLEGARGERSVMRTDRLI